MASQWVSLGHAAAAASRRATIFSLQAVLAILLVGLPSGAALLSATKAIASSDAAAGSALRSIDQAALQALLAKTARELHIPGAVVLLRTPQGEFTAGYGTTVLHARIRPSAHTHFRIASITKTMTSAVVLQLAQEGKLGSATGLEIRSRRAERRQHHARRAAEDAQRPLRLHQRPRDGAVLRPRADQSLDPAGSAGDRIRAPAQLRAGHGLRVQQHQLRAARSRRREGRWPVAGQGDAGTVVPATRHEEHITSRPVPRTASPSPSRTATCTAAPRSSPPASRTRPTMPSSAPRSRPARSSPKTTPV